MDRLESGQLSLRSVLQRVPSALKSADIYDVLCRSRNIGRVLARRICEDTGTWPHTTLGELTRRERYDLRRALPRHIK